MRDLILIFLASYFVTWVIVHSTIALTIVERWQHHWEARWIRKHAGLNEHVAAAMWEDEGWNSKLAYLPTCAYCTGFWVSGLVVGVAQFAAPMTIWWLVWLASAALVGLVDSLVHHEA